MKKEIIEVKDGAYRITTVDERWYARTSKDKKTGLPVYEYIPSVTWICESWPKGVGFYKWLAQKGWDEAEALKEAAGERGSKVHKACEMVDQGIAVTMDMAFAMDDGTTATLTPEEYEAVLSFQRWLDKEQPELVACEVTVFGDGYAGTIDRIYKWKDSFWIVDLKTSKAVWPSHIIQISAYRHADLPNVKGEVKLGILQVGYARNGNGYKFTEVEDRFDLFQAAQQIWAYENPDAKPKQRDLPMQIIAECRKGKDGKVS